MQRALVISIHDVAPETRARVEQMISELSGIGVACCSLLVVPDYHHRGRSLGEPVLLRRLRELEVGGHEIVIHGYYHERVRRPGESARQKLLTRVYTADEGEFYDLGYEAALRVLREAKEEFSMHGFHPTGFIAPAWLLGVEAQRAAVDAGFRYTTTLREVRDFSSGKEFFSQSLVYSVRSDWRSAMSLVWNRMLFHRLTNNPLLRLGLHPPDFERRAVWRQVRELVTKALTDHRPMTYQDWLNEKSTVDHPQSVTA